MRGEVDGYISRGKEKKKLVDVFTLDEFFPQAALFDVYREQSVPQLPELDSQHKTTPLPRLGRKHDLPHKRTHTAR